MKRDSLAGADLYVSNVGAHPAFELIDVPLDILNGDGRGFLLQ